MDWERIITAFHIIGTVFGVGGSTFAEIFFLQALKDGVVDPSESSFLKITYKVIHIGSIIILLSGFAYLLNLRIEGHSEYIYSTRTIFKIFLLIIIGLNSILFTLKKIPFFIASPIFLTSWYAAIILGLWRGLRISYLPLTIYYVAAIVIVGVSLYYTKKFLHLKV